MGDVWERLIRSTKTLLRTLVNDSSSKLLTDESLTTLLAEVEAILNDRPLTANPSSVDDAPALTPNMLLTFQRRPTTPPGTFSSDDQYSRRWWRQAQHLANVFWKRWIHEYLPTLQLRQKWTHQRPELRVDDLVLVCEENTSRGDWPLGRVVELIKGRDDLARSVRVLVRGKEKIRPITKLCFLEHHD